MVSSSLYFYIASAGVSPSYYGGLGLGVEPMKVDELMLFDEKLERFWSTLLFIL